MILYASLSSDSLIPGFMSDTASKIGTINREGYTYLRFWETVAISKDAMFAAHGMVKISPFTPPFLNSRNSETKRKNK
jgi:hypothetical protein